MLFLYNNSEQNILKNTFNILLAISVIILQSCRFDKDKSDNERQKVKLSAPIIRLDSLLFASKNEAEVFKLLENNKIISESYFETPSQNFPELAKKLFEFIQNPTLGQFYNETINNTTGIKINYLQNAINQAFSNIKVTYPNFKAPKVYTFFTGFAGKDIQVTDSAIVIGLEYFAGKNAKYRPQVYDYQLKKYQKEYIVPSILNQLAIKKAKIDPLDKSLLADMLFYGKCYQFTKMMIPNVADSLIIGYSQKELDATEVSQEMVWAHMVDQKLLYETSPFKKAKYLEERPNTQEISPDCPGMIGRWLGWKIVKKYLENNSEQSLISLLQNPKAQDIFEKSKYKGKGDLN